MAQINERQLKGIFVWIVVTVNGWVLHVEGVENPSDLCIMYPRFCPIAHKRMQQRSRRTRARLEAIFVVDVHMPMVTAVRRRYARKPTDHRSRR